MTVAPTVSLMLLVVILLQPSVVSSPVSQANRTKQFVRVYPSDAPRLVMPKAIQTPHPHYTPEAMQAGVQGRIVLEVTVGQDGHVRDAMVTKGLDTATDDRALDAISAWLFEPGTLDGHPVAVRTTVTFDMSLR